MPGSGFRGQAFQCAVYLVFEPGRVAQQATVDEILQIQQSPVWPRIFAIRHRMLTENAGREAEDRR